MSKVFSTHSAPRGLDDCVSDGIISACDRHVFQLCAVVIVSRFLVLAYPSFDVLFQVLGIAGSVVAMVVVFSAAKISKFELGYLFILAVMLTSQCFYTMIVRQQSVFYFFSAAYTYVYCLLLFPFSYLLNKYGVREIMHRLQVLALYIALFMLLSALVKNLVGVTLIEAMRERVGAARFGEPELIDVILVYSCWAMIENGGHLLDILTAICCSGAIFLVSQTRVVEFVMLVSCALVVIASVRGANYKLLLVIVFIVVTVGIAAAGIISSFFSSFSTTGAEASSTLVRFDEVQYYWSLFRQNPLMGVGMIAYNSPAHYLICGAYGNFFPDDVGIIGALGTIGIWIFPLYILPLFAFLKRTLRVDSDFKSLFIALLVYLIGTSATLLVAYPFCSTIWPLLIALFDMGNNASCEAVVASID